MFNALTLKGLTKSNPHISNTLGKVSPPSKAINQCASKMVILDFRVALYFPNEFCNSVSQV